MDSRALFHKALELLPGGVSSPVRAIRPYPFYTVRAKGSKLHTAEGKELIDCCMAYGPLLLGHNHPEIRTAIQEQLHDGWLYGTPIPKEIEFAAMLVADHPGMGMVRFVSTGAEATMAAIRLARGYTGRRGLVKAEGGFHGAHDAVLIRAGSGATTMGVPDSAGVLPEVAALTYQVPFNDAEALSSLLEKKQDIAAFIVEPVMGNIGPILPSRNYLEEIRGITKEHDVLLILDEVITGYRIGIGGAQALFGIRPDLTTLGKIIGGGLPIGALLGRKEIMQMVAPAGPVYQAGTFNGNPLSLAAGIATLKWIKRHKDIYARLDEGTRSIADEIGPEKGCSFVRIGSMFKLFFRDEPPRNYAEAKECDTARFAQFWQRMLDLGVFLPPSQFETNFLSVAHSDVDIDRIGAAYTACI
ncbi:MAG: glutamate-1-semialdehyde 2,1-aminomutase [Methanomicrobiales archaeon]|nr:glutamate-1-semialdehyde 2,1-aminomutase [Methanomicrobiales archaeon]